MSGTDRDRRVGRTGRNRRVGRVGRNRVVGIGWNDSVLVWRQCRVVTEYGGIVRCALLEDEAIVFSVVFYGIVESSVFWFEPSGCRLHEPLTGILSPFFGFLSQTRHLYNVIMFQPSFFQREMIMKRLLEKK